MCSIRLFYLNLQKTELLMQDYQLDFITYCVGNLADRLKMSASTVYKMLRSTGILDGYIVPCYDVLHTFSRLYHGRLDWYAEKERSLVMKLFHASNCI